MSDWALPPAAILKCQVVELDSAGDAWRDAILAAFQDPDFYRWGYVPQPPRAERRTSWLNTRALRERIGAARYFAIRLVDARNIVGLIDLFIEDLVNRWAEIGYWIDPRYRNRGVATRALRLVTTWAIESASATQVDLPIHPDHRASQAVARKAGYVWRGHCHQAQPVGGSHIVEPLHPFRRAPRMIREVFVSGDQVRGPFPRPRTAADRGRRELKHPGPARLAAWEPAADRSRRHLVLDALRRCVTRGADDACEFLELVGARKR